MPEKNRLVARKAMSAMGQDPKRNPKPTHTAADSKMSSRTQRARRCRGMVFQPRGLASRSSVQASKRVSTPLTGLSLEVRRSPGGGHVRQAGVIPQRHPDHQLAATSSPLTSSIASPSITSSLALASDSGLM